MSVYDVDKIVLIVRKYDKRDKTPDGAYILKLAEIFQKVDYSGTKSQYPRKRSENLIL